MKLPTRKEINELLLRNDPHSVSLYFPFEGTPEAERIRLKNDTKLAASKLNKDGLPAKKVVETLAPLRALQEAGHPRLQSNSSLVVFVSPEFFKHFYIPELVTKSLEVKQGFTVSPLQQIVRDLKEYYVLSLNHNDVQLFKSNHYDLVSVTPKGFPTNVNKTLNIDEYPRVIETHTVAPASRSHNSEAFHGHYNESEVDKKLLKEFFRRIDQHVYSHLSKKRHPLIIGGVDYLLSMYRRVNSYPHLLDEHIVGNLERTSPQELLWRSREVYKKAMTQNA